MSQCIALDIPADGRAFDELRRAKVPMIRKTFPVMEPTVRVYITRPDQFFRANGRVVSRNLALFAARSSK